MKRKRYFVSPDKNQWILQSEGSRRAIKRFKTKKEALDFSRRFVREKKPSQLIIQKENGRIQTEHTYEKDPYPPKG